MSFVCVYMLIFNSHSSNHAPEHASQIRAMKLFPFVPTCGASGLIAKWFPDSALSCEAEGQCKDGEIETETDLQYSGGVPWNYQFTHECTHRRHIWHSILDYQIDLNPKDDSCPMDLAYASWDVFKWRPWKTGSYTCYGGNGLKANSSLSPHFEFKKMTYDCKKECGNKGSLLFKCCVKCKRLQKHPKRINGADQIICIGCSHSEMKKAKSKGGCNITNGVVSCGESRKMCQIGTPEKKTQDVKCEVIPCEKAKGCKMKAQCCKTCLEKKCTQNCKMAEEQEEVMEDGLAANESRMKKEMRLGHSCVRMSCTGCADISTCSPTTITTTTTFLQ
jgi:hypothetical protein